MQTAQQYFLALRDRAARAPAAELTCDELRDVFRYAPQLAELGLDRWRIKQLAGVYARRVDELGVDEFDHRCLVGVA